MVGSPRPILCIRPEPGLSDTIRRGEQIGLSITGYPLFAIEPVDWDLPETLDFDGILLGSANAIRFGGKQLHRLTHLPVFAVGGTTAKVALEAGFAIDTVGEGGLQGLLDNLPVRSIRLLRLAGEEKVPLSPASWQEIVERVAYRSADLPIPNTMKSVLQNNPIVALHSAKAAEHFASECNRMGLDRSTISLATLGARIAQAAGMGWGRITTAQAPRDAALLATIQNMCK